MASSQVSVCTPTGSPRHSLARSQALYVHDFPLLANPGLDDPSSNPTHTPFTRPILDLLESMGLPSASLAPFAQHDFSTSAEVRAVVTKQGKWVGWQEMDRGGGMVDLARVVKELELTGPDRWTVEAAGSAVGKMAPNWLGAMYAVSMRGPGGVSGPFEAEGLTTRIFQACGGVSPREWGFAEQGKLPPGKRLHVPSAPEAALGAQTPLKVIYPSERQSEYQVVQKVAPAYRPVLTQSDAESFF